MLACRITASREGSGTSSLVALHPQRNLGAGPATDSEWYIIAARRRLMSAPNHCPKRNVPKRNLSKQTPGPRSARLPEPA